MLTLLIFAVVVLLGVALCGTLLGHLGDPKDPKDIV